MEYVFVKARGLKSLPSWAWSVKIGRNEKVIIRREKKSAGPTSDAASAIMRHLAGPSIFTPWLTARSTCL